MWLLSQSLAQSFDYIPWRRYRNWRKIVINMQLSQ